MVWADVLELLAELLLDEDDGCSSVVDDELLVWAVELLLLVWAVELDEVETLLLDDDV